MTTTRPQSRSRGLPIVRSTQPFALRVTSSFGTDSYHFRCSYGRDARGIALAHEPRLRPGVKRIADLVRVVRRRVVVAVLFVGVAVAAAGCETSSTLSAGPDPVKCQVSLGTTAMVEAVGGTWHGRGHDSAGVRVGSLDDGELDLGAVAGLRSGRRQRDVPCRAQRGHVGTRRQHRCQRAAGARVPARALPLRIGAGQSKHRHQRRRVQRDDHDVERVRVDGDDRRQLDLADTAAQRKRRWRR